jgi:hypothetical protein
MRSSGRDPDMKNSFDIYNQERLREMQAEMARQAILRLRKEKNEKDREDLKENKEILSANFTK